jgi:hypothetical protein
MNSAGFDELMRVLWTSEERQLHLSREVSPEQKTLMFLWYVANQNCFREIADKFNVTKSKAHKCVLEVLDKVCDLARRYIKWPSEQEMTASSLAFGRTARCPRAIGAIDGCHIRIQRPHHHSAGSYLNRKGYYSILLQGICNESGKFLDVFIGLPGCVHDSRMLRLSDFFEDYVDRMRDHTLLGDSAYIGRSYQTFIQTPTRDNGRLTTVENSNNAALSAGRVIIENAFGRLKCKFRRLRDLQNTRLDISVKLILASCTLYNFCIINDFECHCEDHPNCECLRENDDNDD